MNSTLTRVRPYAVVAAAIAVITLVPARTIGHRGTGRTPVTEVAAPAAAPGAAATVGTVTAPSVSEPAPGSAPSSATGSPRAAATLVRKSAAPSSAPRTAATAVSAARVVQAAVTGAGIGTPEALNAPDCDRGLGRVKVSLKAAPFCVRPWPAGSDNGGATATGVTGDKISVVVVLGGTVGGATDSDRAKQKQSFLDQQPIFQHTYRTWGRTVELTFVNPPGDDEPSQRALAIDIASRHPFAAFTLPGSRVLDEELASRGVMAESCTGGSFKDAQAKPGFLWAGYYNLAENGMASVAEYIGKRLTGRPAQWAGDATMRPQQRVFGLAYQDALDMNIVNGHFARSNVALAERVSYPNDPTTYQERARTIVGRMKDKGVTTIIAATDLAFNAILTKEATAQQWFPDWVITPLNGVDWFGQGLIADSQQWNHAFGVGSIPPANAYWQPKLWEWYYGSGRAYNSDNSGICGMNSLWWLYTGVHMAGPNLMPQSFAQGLFALPASGGVLCTCVNVEQMSFGKWGGTEGADDYWAIDDFNELWWDPLAPGVLGQPGSYRYVNGGKRLPLGKWPATEPQVFDSSKAQTPNDIGDVPADHAPNYPCPGCPSASGG